MTRAAAVIPHTPEIFMRDGVLLTNSLEVAKHFDKRHDHVMRDIEELIRNEPDLGAENFYPAATLNTKTDRLVRSYDMDESGFMLVVMGFTGARALKVKIAYTKQFKAMKEALAARAPVQAPPMVIDYDDADFLRHVIAGVGAKLAEKEQQLQIAHVEIAEAKTEIAVVKTELQVVSGKAKLWERYLDAEDHMILSDAAKLLGVSHGKFFKRLVEAKILFYRDPERKRGLRAAQKYEDKGYFVLKGGVTRANNYSFLQTYVAKGGLEFLAVFFERVDLFNQLQRS